MLGVVMWWLWGRGKYLLVAQVCGHIGGCVVIEIVSGLGM